jgi:hypothetical protein
MPPPVAVCFLLHFPGPRGRWALPTTMSYGARTFLQVDSRSGIAQRPPGPLRITIYHTPPLGRVIGTANRRVRRLVKIELGIWRPR